MLCCRKNDASCLPVAVSPSFSLSAVAVRGLEREEKGQTVCLTSPFSDQYITQLVEVLSEMWIVK